MPYIRAIAEPEIESRFPYSPSCSFYCHLKNKHIPLPLASSSHIVALRILRFEGHTGFQDLNHRRLLYKSFLLTASRDSLLTILFGAVVFREMKRKGSVKGNAEALTKVIL